MKWNRLKSLKVTFDDIQHAVSDNAKQRFALKLNPAVIPPPPASTNPSHYLIRANQGHSIALSSASLLTPLTLAAGNVPPTVVHGTYYAFYPAILQAGGLKPMSRNHIHCSTGLPEDTGSNVVSGMRNDAELLIYIDVARSLADGQTKWWISDNGVVLTEGDAEGLVRPEYWKRVVGRKGDVGVLWEDGRGVAELPESVRGRRPPGGKGQRGERSKGEGKGKGKAKGNGGITELDVVEPSEGMDEGAPVYVETVKLTNRD